MRRTGLAVMVAGLGLGAVLSRVPSDRTGEREVSRWLARHRRPAITRIALGIDSALNAPWSMVLPTLASLACVPRFGWRSGTVVAGLTATGWSASHLAKKVFRRPRPTDVDAVVDLTLPDSFPSGHTALATAMVCAVAVTLEPSAGPAIRPIGALLVAATGASRVYLGAHHLGDVVAAPLIAGGAVLLGREVLRQRFSEASPPVERAATNAS